MAEIDFQLGITYVLLRSVKVKCTSNARTMSSYSFKSSIISRLAISCPLSPTLLAPTLSSLTGAARESTGVSLPGVDPFEAMTPAEAKSLRRFPKSIFGAAWATGGGMLGVGVERDCV